MAGQRAGVRTRWALSTLLLWLALGLATGCTSPAVAPAGPPAAATNAPRPPGDGAGAPVAGVAATPVPLERVRLAYSSIAGVAAIPLIARDRGYYAANGLDAEVVYVASGATAVQSLLSGELTFVLGGTEAIVNASAAGAELAIFAGLVDTVPFSLMVRPDISRPEELVGQRLGVTRLGSATDYALRAALRLWNLDATRDVTIVQLGGIPEIRAGLESGAVAGGTISLPVLAQAKRDGYRELVDLASLGIAYQTTSVAATRRLLAERPTTAARLVRALSEAIHVIKTDRPAALAAFRDMVQESDEQVLEETYERYGLQYIQRIPAPSREGISAVQQQIAASDPRVASVRLDDLIDERVVRDLEAEGFYARLYGGR
jgi:NitT/TauT family transport system substrate-binding protein